MDVLRPGSAASSSTHREASGYLEQGRRSYNSKDYAAAEESFRDAILTDSKYSLAHYYLGLCLYKLDKSGEAIKSWQRAIEVGPGSDAAYKADRKINYAKCKVNKAISDLENRMK